MEDYIEDYKYNNCFWKKSGVLYNHAESKFKEYMSIGDMVESFAKAINIFYTTIDKIPDSYIPSDDVSCTRGKGISVFIHCLRLISGEIRKLYKKMDYIASRIKEKKLSYESKKDATKLCDDQHKKYQNELNKLSAVKKAYFTSVNKAIEFYLNQKYSNKLNNNKIKTELNNRKKLLLNKKEEYKNQINEVEKFRIEYMEMQGNIFACEEELERDCTNELKDYFMKFIKIMKDFFKTFIISEENNDIIEKINGEKDNKSFAEKNKSLMTGPKRNLYKEYAQDLSYYTEHFDIIKSKLKGKDQKEIREFNNKITQDINEFLGDLIKEEPDEIQLRIEQIAKDIKENKLSKKDYEYLETQFQKRYDEFLKWKEEKVCDQDFRKIGKEWDERFCYMHKFLGYFNKTRVENKELDKTNFDYLCNAIKKILQLNENEDIDYNLCDLIVILSSTFYMLDPNGKNGKKYVNEVIKNCSIMQKQGFWVGLTKFELNEEIQQQNNIEDTLKENNITEAKLNNSVIAKLMSVSYNIIQFVMDSNLFNKIIFDIFKYCKINEENRAIIAEMIEGQIQSENLNHLKLNKELLLNTPINSENIEIQKSTQSSINDSEEK